MNPDKKLPCSADLVETTRRAYACERAAEVVLDENFRTNQAFLSGAVERLKVRLMTDPDMLAPAAKRERKSLDEKDQDAGKRRDQNFGKDHDDVKPPVAPVVPKATTTTKAPDYSTLKYNRLKQICAELGLSGMGTREELLKRLSAHHQKEAAQAAAEQTTIEPSSTSTATATDSSQVDDSQELDKKKKELQRKREQLDQELQQLRELEEQQQKEQALEEDRKRAQQKAREEAERKALEEKARREEEARKKALEEEIARRKAEEEAEKLRKMAEEVARRKAQEEEEARRKALEAQEAEQKAKEAAAQAEAEKKARLEAERAKAAADAEASLLPGKVPVDDPKRTEKEDRISRDKMIALQAMERAKTMHLKDKVSGPVQKANVGETPTVDSTIVVNPHLSKVASTISSTLIPGGGSTGGNAKQSPAVSRLLNSGRLPQGMTPSPSTVATTVSSGSTTRFAPPTDKKLVQTPQPGVPSTVAVPVPHIGEVAVPIDQNQSHNLPQPTPSSPPKESRSSWEYSPAPAGKKPSFQQHTPPSDDEDDYADWAKGEALKRALREQYEGRRNPDLIFPDTALDEFPMEAIFKKPAQPRRSSGARWIDDNVTDDERLNYLRAQQHGPF